MIPPEGSLDRHQRTSLLPRKTNVLVIPLNMLHSHEIKPKALLGLLNLTFSDELLWKRTRRQPCTHPCGRPSSRLHASGGRHQSPLSPRQQRRGHAPGTHRALRSAGSAPVAGPDGPRALGTHLPPTGRPSRGYGTGPLGSESQARTCLYLTVGTTVLFPRVRYLQSQVFLLKPNVRYLKTLESMTATVGLPTS